MALFGPQQQLTRELLQADTLFQAEEYDAAALMYTHILENFTIERKLRARVHSRFAVCLHKLGHDLPALQTAQAGIILDATNGEPFFVAGVVCWNLERFEEADAHYKKAIELTPPHDAEYAAMIESYSKFKTQWNLRKKLEPIATKLKDEAKVLFDAGKYAEAEKLYCAPFHLPHSDLLSVELRAILLSNISSCFFKQKKFIEAFNQGLVAVELRPDWSRGHFRVAVAAAELKKYDEADAAFKKCLQLEPTNTEVQEKYAAFRKAREEAELPRSLQAIQDEAETCCANKNFVKAAHLLSQAIALNPKDSSILAQLHSRRSTCYIHVGKFQEALVDAQNAVRLSPNSVSGFKRVAEAAEKLEDFALSISSLEKCVILEKGSTAKYNKQIAALKATMKKKEKQESEVVTSTSEDKKVATSPNDDDQQNNNGANGDHISNTTQHQQHEKKVNSEINETTKSCNEKPPKNPKKVNAPILNELRDELTDQNKKSMTSKKQHHSKKRDKKRSSQIHHFFSSNGNDDDDDNDEAEDEIVVDTDFGAHNNSNNNYNFVDENAVEARRAAIFDFLKNSLLRTPSSSLVQAEFLAFLFQDRGHSDEITSLVLDLSSPANSDRVVVSLQNLFSDSLQNSVLNPHILEMHLKKNVMNFISAAVISLYFDSPEAAVKILGVPNLISYLDSAKEFVPETQLGVYKTILRAVEGTQEDSNEELIDDDEADEGERSEERIEHEENNNNIETEQQTHLDPLEELRDKIDELTAALEQSQTQNETLERSNRKLQHQVNKSQPQKNLSFFKKNTMEERRNKLLYETQQLAEKQMLIQSEEQKIFSKADELSCREQRLAQHQRDLASRQTQLSGVERQLSSKVQELSTRERDIEQDRHELLLMRQKGAAAAATNTRDESTEIWNSVAFLNRPEIGAALNKLDWEPSREGGGLKLSSPVSDPQDLLFKFVVSKFRATAANLRRTGVQFSGKNIEIRFVRPLLARAFLDLHDKGNQVKTANQKVNFAMSSVLTSDAQKDTLKKFALFYDDAAEHAKPGATNINTAIPHDSRLVFAWHGTTIEAAEVICRDGLQSLRKTDAGFFGAADGYYAVSAEYAHQYCTSTQGHQGWHAMILFCLSVSRVYPVTLSKDYRSEEDPATPHLHGFSKFYTGEKRGAKALMPGFDCHFIPTKSYGGNHPLGTYKIKGDPLQRTRLQGDIWEQACDANDPDCWGHEIVLKSSDRALPVAIMYFKK